MAKHRVLVEICWRSSAPLLGSDLPNRSLDSECRDMPQTYMRVCKCITQFRPNSAKAYDLVNLCPQTQASPHECKGSQCQTESRLILCNDRLYDGGPFCLEYQRKFERWTSGIGRGARSASRFIRTNLIIHPREPPLGSLSCEASQFHIASCLHLFPS